MKIEITNIPFDYAKGRRGKSNAETTLNIVKAFLENNADTLEIRTELSNGSACDYISSSSIKITIK